ncbi:MAG: type II toxin-antitoxin system RelE/ParE family toxin [Phycicoccus sp.]|nr:type II toxin-antitoxin system RelE/ParE family toxin [Dermatophilaceae bacterium]MBP6997862.1 type II toxin-antitoxin system RelE/ParE family toxin [Phycicoccus sp.]
MPPAVDSLVAAAIPRTSSSGSTSSARRTCGSRNSDPASAARTWCAGSRLSCARADSHGVLKANCSRTETFRWRARRKAHPSVSSPHIGGQGEWRVRTGDYRIVYEVNDDVLVVLVVAVGHRGEINQRR